MRSRSSAGLMLVLAACVTRDPTATVHAGAAEVPTERSAHGAAPAVAPAPVAPVQAPVQLTLLMTGDEGGYLLPATDETGVERGGAAQVLGQWLANEGHCVGCADPSTLVLSTGDSANGAPISTFFHGQSTAQLLQHLGYAASAFGDHDLDVSRQDFIANQKVSGVRSLAANLTATDDDGRSLGLAPSQLFIRRGVKVGVVGLTNQRIPRTTFAGRLSGLTLQADEAALTAAVPAVWAQGANAVVVLADGCLDELVPALSRHPEWKLTAVVGRRCAAELPAAIGATWLFAPRPRWQQYSRLKLAFANGQLRTGEPATIDVVHSGGGATPEPQALALLAPWQGKLTAALGEEIGFTRTGAKQTDPRMAAWVATALEKQTGAEAALINLKGVRHALKPGAITRLTVYELLPFEDSVVKVTVPVDEMALLFDNPNVLVVGLNKKSKKLTRKKAITLATTDYLYFGGDGVALEQVDPDADFTGIDWRTALIEYTRRLGSSQKKPLESFVR